MTLASPKTCSHRLALRWAPLLLAGVLAPAAWSGPPGDEEVWSIRCVTLPPATTSGPELAQRYAEALKKTRGLKASLVEIVRTADGTTVFYGRYQREYSPTGEGRAFKPDPKQDLDKIRNLSMRVRGTDPASGVQGERDVWPFYLATVDLLPTYKSRHPEWNLEHVEGHWALHVAVFFNTNEFRERRSAAEQYCALLREKGEQAYYHHGAVNSSVYIGPFPRTAIVEVRTENPLNNMVTTKLKIVDEGMRAAQERHPHSLQNGGVVYELVRDRQGTVKERVPGPSFPVVIPKAERTEAEQAPARPQKPGEVQKPPGW
ncbi:MAG: hypothetical protein AB1716_06375 [Planctomycetota bacterium]